MSADNEIVWQPNFRGLTVARTRCRSGEGRTDPANRHRGIDDRDRCKTGGLVAYRSGAAHDQL